MREIGGDFGAFSENRCRGFDICVSVLKREGFRCVEMVLCIGDFFRTVGFCHTPET